MEAPTSTGIVQVVGLAGAVHIITLTSSVLSVAFAKISMTADSSAFPLRESVPSASSVAIPSIEEVFPKVRVPSAVSVAMASSNEVA